jgi:hypothetical protein
MIWLVTRVGVDLGIGLDSDFPLYLTPVDYVADAWVRLALDPSAIGGIYHLVDTSGFTMGDLHKGLIELGYPLKMLALEEFQEEMFAKRQEESAKPIAAYMNLFPEDAKRAFLDAFALPNFSNERTREQLDEAISERAAMTPERLRLCVDYFIETEFLPAPSGTKQV